MIDINYWESFGASVKQEKKAAYFEMILFFSVKKKRIQIRIWSFHCLPNTPLSYIYNYSNFLSYDFIISYWQSVFSQLFFFRKLNIVKLY